MNEADTLFLAGQALTYLDTLAQEAHIPRIREVMTEIGLLPAHEMQGVLEDTEEQRTRYLIAVGVRQEKPCEPFGPLYVEWRAAICRYYRLALLRQYPTAVCVPLCEITEVPSQ